MVSSVVVDGIPDEEFPRKGCYSLRTTLDQQMNVVIHKDPGVHGALGLYDACFQSLTEFRPIETILEECPLVDPSHHDVMRGSRSI